MGEYGERLGVRVDGGAAEAAAGKKRRCGRIRSPRESPSRCWSPNSTLSSACLRAMIRTSMSSATSAALSAVEGKNGSNETARTALGAEVEGDLGVAWP